MELLWSFQELAEKLQSPRDAIRQWAAQNLADFYPDLAAPLMVNLLKESGELLHLASRYFSDQPQYADEGALLKACKHAEGHSLAHLVDALGHSDRKACARILVQRCSEGTLGVSFFFPEVLRGLAASTDGLDLLHGLLETSGPKKQEDYRFLIPNCVRALVETRSKSEFLHLLHFAIGKTWRERSIVLREFSRLAGLPMPASEFRMDTRAPQGRLSEMQKLGLHPIRKDSPQLADELKRLLRQGLDMQAIELLYRQSQQLFNERKLALTGRHRDRLAFYPDLLSALIECKELIEAGKPVFRRRVSATALVIYRCLLERKRFLGIAPEDASPVERLDLLLREEEDTSEDETLIRLLAQAPPPGAAAECLKKIEQYPASLAKLRALKLAGLLRCPEAAPHLVREIEEDAEFLEEYLAICRKMGDLLLPSLMPLCGDKRFQQELLAIFHELPFAQTVSAVITAFSDFHEADRDELLHLVRSLGHHDFIPLIKQYMRYEEPEEETYWFLCRLHEVESPELERIEEFIREQEEFRNRTLQGEPPAPFEKVPLPLRCARCGRVYSYRVRQVIVDSESKGFQDITIPESIVCKNCGARDCYELEYEGQAVLAGVLLRMKGQSDSAGPGPVEFSSFRVDGKLMGIAQAEAYYREKIARHPGRPEYRVSLGNVLNSLKREQEAYEQFQKAIEFEPFAIEAYYAIANIDSLTGKKERALRGFEKCLQIASRARYFRLAPDQRPELVRHVQSAVSDLRQDLGMNIRPDALPAAKFGRNDPCPCGSGKKYKHCCLK